MEHEWAYVLDDQQLYERQILFQYLQKKERVIINPRNGIRDDIAENSSERVDALHRSPLAAIRLKSDIRSQFMINPPPIVGYVIYSDIFGQRYKHHFAFVAHPTWGKSFRRHGGRSYNYEEDLEEQKENQHHAPPPGAFAT